MVFRNCFAPKCFKSTHRRGVVNEKCFTFVPPKDPELFQQWSKAMPRLDKQLSHSDRLCEVHFLPQDIRSQQVSVIEGKPVFLPLNQPKLREGAGGCQDKPTCSSFLQLFRLLTLYYPTKSTVRGNIDNTEQLELIFNYKTWLTTRFKDQEKRRKLAHKYTNDVHLLGIIVQLLEEADVASGVESEATPNDNIVYYICGYMARQQSKKNNACQECQESLGNFSEINNITAAELTKKTKLTTNLLSLLQTSID